MKREEGESGMPLAGKGSRPDKRSTWLVGGASENAFRLRGDIGKEAAKRSERAAGLVRGN